MIIKHLTRDVSMCAPGWGGQTPERARFFPFAKSSRGVVKQSLKVEFSEVHPVEARDLCEQAFLCEQETSSF